MKKLLFLFLLICCCACEDGEAYITRMDGTIISGTFSGGSIKEGRFDIKYREKPEGGEAVY